MNRLNYCLALLVTFCLISCRTTHPGMPTDDGKIQLAILQMNDVYEMNGVDNGQSGGLSRVAYYYKEVKKQYPLTMLVMAGDFLNPSLIGTMKYNNESIKGRQMVEVLNAMNLDLAVFGNHEFDLDEDDLQRRLNESAFDWISTNVYQVCGDRQYPFYKERNGRKEFFPESKLYHFKDDDGTTLDLGIFSATLSMNPRDYVHYLNPDSCASVEIEMLKKSSDVVIGLTHLVVDDDLALAKKHPEVPLIMGGHEHDHMIHQVGNTIVAKADANAKTVYLHLLDYDKKSKKTSITNQLIKINEDIPKDPGVDNIIQKWNDILNTKIKQVIPDPYEVIYKTSIPIDGRESTIRHSQTSMGQLFTKAMLAASRKNSVAAILNSGSIRIDDQLEGAIAAIDIFRALPYGGAIIEIELSGKLLSDVLAFSENAKGNGAYLQRTGVEIKNEEWWINGQKLDKTAIYTIAINDYLLTGLDIPILTKDSEGIQQIYAPEESAKNDLRNDIRKAIIEYLKTVK